MKTNCKCVLLVLLFLLGHSIDIAADEILFRVRGDNANFERTITAGDGGASVGSLLKEELELLGDGVCCWVYAEHETTVIASKITVDASNLNLVMRNVTIKAPEGESFSNIIRFTGEDCIVFGVKVEGPDDRTESTDPTSGIELTGTNGNLIHCEASNMPDGNRSRCFFVRGDEAKLSCCKAKNPGYTCIQSTAANATYDRIEAIIDSPTLNGNNRLFNSSGSPETDDGVVRIMNSKFTAMYPVDTPIELQEAVFRIGDHQLFEMSDCSIVFNENVDNRHAGNDVIKLSNRVEEAKFIHVDIETANPNFRGHALQLASDDFSDDTKLDCEILNCDFDQGILSAVTADSLIIKNSVIGRETSQEFYLFQSIGRVKTVRIEDTDLFNSGAMMHFGVNDSLDRKMSLKNVDFRSATSRQTTYVFSDAWYRYPRRASFLDAKNFTYGRTENGVYPLYLATTKVARLAMTSEPDEFDREGGCRSLQFDDRYFGISGPAAIPGPPFTEMPGVDGDRIYPHSDNDLSANNWDNADYWEYDDSAGEWQPYTAL